MLRSVRSLYALCALLPCLLASGDPAPPPAHSALGYLRVSAEAEVPPASDKIFLRPQQELFLIEDRVDSYVFVAPSKDGSSLCKMPKMSRYTMMLSFPDDPAKGVLRGPLELETLPLKLPLGLELPVVSSDASSWLALCSLKPFEFRLRIPRGQGGVDFSKDSLFDIFSADQKVKGLSLYEGSWIPSEKAAALKAAAEHEARARIRLHELLRSSAAAGRIVMKDGSILEGKFKGSSGDKILFEPSSGDQGLRELGVEEIAEMSIPQALAIGALKAARDAFESARQAFLAKDYGSAAKGFESAAAKLKSVAQGTEAKADSRAKLSSDLDSARQSLSQALDSAGLALYKYQAFPKKELESHLAKGDVLLRDSIWVKPSQICLRCKGDGSVECPLCKGLGSISKDCPHCVEGQLECQVCHGSGMRRCPTCDGHGGFSKTCANCGGSGLVWKASGILGFEPGYVNAPRVAVTSSGFIVSYRPPIIGDWGGDPYRYIQVSCQRCGGTGVEKTSCGTCGGLGAISCPKTLACPYCGGKGTLKSACPLCGGKTKTACPDCKGKGYLGDSQSGEPDGGAPESGGGIIQSQPRVSPL